MWTLLAIPRNPYGALVAAEAIALAEQGSPLGTDLQDLAPGPYGHGNQPSDRAPVLKRPGHDHERSASDAFGVVPVLASQPGRPGIRPVFHRDNRHASPQLLISDSSLATTVLVSKTVALSSSIM
jgi:hypothetical protein